MSLEPAQANIPANDDFPPDGGTEPGTSTADPGRPEDRRQRRYVGQHRRADGAVRRAVKHIVRFWPAALRTALLLAILATGMTALAGPVGFSAQVLLIVMEVWARKG